MLEGTSSKATADKALASKAGGYLRLAIAASGTVRQPPRHVKAMNAYKKYITIEDPNHVVLSDLPFKPGQRVEVIILAENSKRAAISEELRELFDRTQTLPGVQDITEDEIAAEIEVYRRGE